jgi:hypothetical protein
VRLGRPNSRFENFEVDKILSTLPEFISRRLLKLLKAITSFYMSVRLPSWNNSATPGRLFMKFGIRITSGP